MLVGMANQNPLKYHRPFHMRVDDEFYDAIKELRRLDDELPSQADVVRNAVFEKRDRVRAQKAKQGARR